MLTLVTPPGIPAPLADVDQNGFLGAPDLVKCFRSLGEDLEDSLIDAMLAQIDADGDGQISLVE